MRRTIIALCLLLGSSPAWAQDDPWNKEFGNSAFGGQLEAWGSGYSSGYHYSWTDEWGFWHPPGTIIKTGNWNGNGKDGGKAIGRFLNYEKTVFQALVGRGAGADCHHCSWAECPTRAWFQDRFGSDAGGSTGGHADMTLNSKSVYWQDGPEIPFDSKLSLDSGHLWDGMGVTLPNSLMSGMSINIKGRSLPIKVSISLFASGNVSGGASAGHGAHSSGSVNGGGSLRVEGTVGLTFAWSWLQDFVDYFASPPTVAEFEFAKQAAGWWGGFLDWLLNVNTFEFFVGLTVTGQVYNGWVRVDSTDGAAPGPDGEVVLYCGGDALLDLAAVTLGYTPIIEIGVFGLTFADVAAKLGFENLADFLSTLAEVQAEWSFGGFQSNPKFDCGHAH